MQSVLEVKVKRKWQESKVTKCDFGQLDNNTNKQFSVCVQSQTYNDCCFFNHKHDLSLSLKLYFFNNNGSN